MEIDKAHSHRKPKSNLTSFIILLATHFSHSLYGQSEQKCLYHDEEITYTTASYQRASSTDIGQPVVIHVVIHVVYQTPEQNISHEKITSQLSVLNEDFNRKNADSINTLPEFEAKAGNAQIYFVLASQDEDGNATLGITRTPTQHGPFFNSDIHYTNKGGKDAWLPSRFLNVWVCDLPEGTFGFGTPPGSESKEDGVVIDFSYFGGNDSGITSGKGRTATHEVGHWLGLKHLWGFTGGCVDDDGIEDTPLQSGPSNKCDLSKNSCGNLNMVQNFMDLSPDDCMNLFTNGQVKEMRRVLFEFRVENFSDKVVTDLSEIEYQLVKLIKNGRHEYLLSSTELIEGLKLFDLAGRQIMINTFLDFGKKEVLLDLSDQRGAFIILISTDKSRQVIRLANVD